MSDQDLSGDTSSNAKAKAIGMITNIMRGTGAVFMLIAVVIGLNLGGAADALGMSSTAKIFGGVLFVLACVEFLVLPPFLAKMLGGSRDR